MVGQLRLHRANDRDFINVFCNPGENTAHFRPALPMSMELERRGKGCPGLTLGPELAAWQLPASMGLQCRLGIKGIHMGWPPIEEKVDDPLCPAGKVRLSGPSPAKRSSPRPSEPRPIPQRRRKWRRSGSWRSVLFIEGLLLSPETWPRWKSGEPGPGAPRAQGWNPRFALRQTGSWHPRPAPLQ